MAEFWSSCKQRILPALAVFSAVTTFSFAQDTQHNESTIAQDAKPASTATFLRQDAGSMVFSAPPGSASAFRVGDKVVFVRRGQYGDFSLGDGAITRIEPITREGMLSVFCRGVGSVKVLRSRDEVYITSRKDSPFSLSKLVDWTILSPKPGQKVRGEDFSVLVGSTFKDLNLHLYVDGKENFDRADPKVFNYPEYEPAFPAQYEAYTPTTGLLNGPHVFEIRGPAGTKQSVKLIVDNVITAEHFDDVFYPAISPNHADDEHPTVCEVRARLQGVARWTVTFFDVDTTTIRKFEGKSDKVKAVWDGRSVKGQLMRDSAYECEITAFAPNGARRQTLHFTTNLMQYRAPQPR